MRGIVTGGPDRPQLPVLVAGLGAGDSQPQASQYQTYVFVGRKRCHTIMHEAETVDMGLAAILMFQASALGDVVVSHNGRHPQGPC